MVGRADRCSSHGACDFYTALGDDELGRRSVERLTELGLDRPRRSGSGATRRALVHVDRERRADDHDRRPEAAARAARCRSSGSDAVFFVAGDVEALRSARAARFLAATPRELPTLREAGVRLDLLVGSGNDPARLRRRARRRRRRRDRGRARRHRRRPPLRGRAAPGPIADTYGAGDSFGAALCFALARGDALDDALALARAGAGAAVVTGKGPYTAQITHVRVWTSGRVVG